VAIWRCKISSCCLKTRLPFESIAATLLGLQPTYALLLLFFVDWRCVDFFLMRTLTIIMKEDRGDSSGKVNKLDEYKKAAKAVLSHRKTKSTHATRFKSAMKFINLHCTSVQRWICVETHPPMDKSNRTNKY
jgi:hypothetical protein